MKFDSLFLAMSFLTLWLKGRFELGVSMAALAALIPIISWVFLNIAACVSLTIPLRRRSYVLPAILLPATISFGTIQYLSFLPGLPEVWGSITLVSLIHVTSLLYIKKWTLRTTPQAGKDSNMTDNWLDRRLWRQMYRVALNPRYVRVPYKDVILFEQGTGSQVKSTAIHGKFSLTKVPRLLIKIGMLSLLDRLATTRLLGVISINDFKPAKAVLLRRLLLPSTYHSADPISVREIVMRIWFTMNAIWTTVILFDSVHTALAIVFIHVIHIDTPDDWPNLFGNPLEAFTLGRFWTMYVDTPRSLTPEKIKLTRSRKGFGTVFT